MLKRSGLAKTKTPARALYDGVLGGFIVGMAVALLVVLYVFSNIFPTPLGLQYLAFFFLILGIIIVAYDAHKVTSAPS